jgi:hypothetical protein
MAGSAPAPAMAEAAVAATPAPEAPASETPAPETSATTAPRPTRKSHIPYGVGIAVAGIDFFLISQHSPFAPYWPWLQ